MAQGTGQGTGPGQGGSQPVSAQLIKKGIQKKNCLQLEYISFLNIINYLYIYYETSLYIVCIFITDSPS